MKRITIHDYLHQQGIGNISVANDYYFIVKIRRCSIWLLYALSENIELAFTTVFK